MYEIKYRKDDEMVNSGVAWLKDVPYSWQLKSIKHCYKFSTGGTPPSGNEQYYSDNGYNWVTISDMKNRTIHRTKNLVSIEGVKKANLKLNKKGSLLYSFKLSVGQVAYLGEDMYTNEAIATFDISNSNSLNYLFYSAPLYIIKNANENIYGAKLLNQDLINNAKILIPKIKEQQKIANFLDIKTAQFDSIIAKKELLIKKLEEAKKSLISEVVTGKVKIVDGKLVKRNSEEMKDSGIDLLGIIPKEWEVKRLKHLASKVGSGKTPKGGAEVYSDKGILFIRSQNIYNEGLILDKIVRISSKMDKQMANSRVIKDDILLNITGASIGRCTHYNESYFSNVNQHVCIIRLLKNISSKEFYAYLIQSNIIQRQIFAYQNGSSREGLNFEQIKNLEFAIPNTSLEIDNMLSTITSRENDINKLITNLILQIQKLKQAKQSLISEAVTGKIDLRDWKIVKGESI